jgi:hypothetical protein
MTLAAAHVRTLGAVSLAGRSAFRSRFGLVRHPSVPVLTHGSSQPIQLGLDLADALKLDLKVVG